MNKSENSKIKSIKRWALVLLIIVAAEALVITSMLYFNEAKKVDEDGGVQGEQGEQGESIVDQVSRHVLLNTQEEPTVLTIKDLSSLKAENPQFYKNAKNGQKILIYSNQIIIYDLEQDKIVNMSSVAD